MRSLRCARLSWVLAAVLAGGIMGWLVVREAQTIDVADLLKADGMVLAVSAWGDRINSFVNDIYNRPTAQVKGVAKVVPIYAMPRGSFVGMAQVVGIPDDVRKVRGVAARRVSVGGRPGTALVPMAAGLPDVSGPIDRVNGIGIAAVIDFHH